MRQANCFSQEFSCKRLVNFLRKIADNVVRHLAKIIHIKVRLLPLLMRVWPGLVRRILCGYKWRIDVKWKLV